MKTRVRLDARSLYTVTCLVIALAVFGAVVAGCGGGGGSSNSPGSQGSSSGSTTSTTKSGWG